MRYQRRASTEPEPAGIELMAAGIVLISAFAGNSLADYLAATWACRDR